MKKQKSANDLFETGEATRVVEDREAAMLFSHEWHLPLWTSPSLADYEPLPEFLAEARCPNKKPYSEWTADELNRAANTVIALLAIKANNGDTEAACWPAWQSEPLNY